MQPCEATGRPSAGRRAQAQTIDALFAPLPVVESRGRAWLYIDNQLKPVMLRLGISDGTYTEVISGDDEGTPRSSRASPALDVDARHAHAGRTAAIR